MVVVRTMILMIVRCVLSLLRRGAGVKLGCLLAAGGPAGVEGLRTAAPPASVTCPAGSNPGRFTYGCPSEIRGYP
jgi:hypothetical protein